MSHDSPLGFPKLWQRDAHLVFVLNYRDFGPAADDVGGTGRVTLDTFRRQIRAMSRVGTFVSLDDIRDGSTLTKINFAITFDGVSRTANSACNILVERKIPFALSLFAPLSIESKPTADAEKGRLSVREVRDLEASTSLATIVNHGMDEDVGPVPSRDQVQAAVRRSTETLEDQLGSKPRYYAVPYEPAHQSLAVDLHEILRELGYRGVLWSYRGANLVRARFKGRLVNLTRLDVPGTTRGLVRALVTSAREAHAGLLDFLPAPEESAEFNFEVGRSPERALAFENVMRESRDYASDPEFYAYLFTQNPYKDARPDYYGVSSNGRLSSIGYNFHARFLVDGSRIDGVYWSSWRKLPGCANTASALTLLNALRAEPIVGAYRPSVVAQGALQSRSWRKIQVSACELDVGAASVDAELPPSDRKVREFSSYDSSIDPLARAACETYRFSIERSPDFYRWRFDRYPLAEPGYLVLHDKDQPTAYFVTLHNRRKMVVADFHCVSMPAFEILLRRALDAARARGIGTLLVETSQPAVVELLRSTFAARIAPFHNYYHFNRTSAGAAPLRSLLADWDNATFHETQASGDVLLR